MITYLGLKMFRKELFVSFEDVDDKEKLDIAPRERTDDVDVCWK